MSVLHFNACNRLRTAHRSSSAPRKDALVMKCIHSTTTIKWLLATRAVCVTAPARLKRHHCSQEKLPLLLVSPFPHGSATLARRDIAAVDEACILAVCVTNVTSCQPLRACRLVTCREIQHIHSGTPTQHVYPNRVWELQQLLRLGWQQVVWSPKGVCIAQPCMFSATEPGLTELLMSCSCLAGMMDS
jgi:hypothetical protein